MTGNTATNTGGGDNNDNYNNYVYDASLYCMTILVIMKQIYKVLLSY